MTYNVLMGTLNLTHSLTLPVGTNTKHNWPGCVPEIITVNYTSFSDISVCVCVCAVGYVQRMNCQAASHDTSRDYSDTHSNFYYLYR